MVNLLPDSLIGLKARLEGERNSISVDDYSRGWKQGRISGLEEAIAALGEGKEAGLIPVPDKNAPSPASYDQAHGHDWKEQPSEIPVVEAIREAIRSPRFGRFSTGEPQQVDLILKAIGPYLKACELCNCTGDVHRADGEWVGACPYCIPKPVSGKLVLTGKEIAAAHKRWMDAGCPKSMALEAEYVD